MDDHIVESSNAELDATLKWHNRLAHVSENGLHILYGKGVFGKDTIS